MQIWILSSFGCIMGVHLECTSRKSASAKQNFWDFWQLDASDNMTLIQERCICVNRWVEIIGPLTIVGFDGWPSISWYQWPFSSNNVGSADSIVYSRVVFISLKNVEDKWSDFPFTFLKVLNPFMIHKFFLAFTYHLFSQRLCTQFSQVIKRIFNSFYFLIRKIDITLAVL